MFSYFSVWTDIQFLLFHLEPPRGLSRRHLLPSTLLSLCISSVGGLYITHVHPKRLYVPYLDHTFERWWLVLMDILGHHLLLLHFVFVDMKPFLRHRPYKHPTLTLHTLLLPFLYGMSEIPHHQFYGLSFLEMTTIVIPIGCLIHHLILQHYDRLYDCIERFFIVPTQKSIKRWDWRMGTSSPYR